MVAAQIQGLVTERDDLVAAIARLREGIATLNKEGRDRLTKAFKEVDGHFRNLFTKLFGGGGAHLELTEAEDPLPVLHDHLARLGKPVLGGWPAGHGTPNRAVPMGALATLDADAGSLRLDQDVLV